MQATTAAGIVGLTLGVIIGIAILFVLGLVLRVLWNSTVPDVFGAKPVTTWQAVKLLFIASMLFGGHRVVTTDAPGEMDEAPLAATQAQ